MYNREARWPQSKVVLVTKRAPGVNQIIWSSVFCLLGSELYERIQEESVWGPMVVFSQTTSFQSYFSNLTYIEPLAFCTPVDLLFKSFNKYYLSPMTYTTPRNTILASCSSWQLASGGHPWTKDNPTTDSIIQPDEFSSMKHKMFLSIDSITSCHNLSKFLWLIDPWSTHLSEWSTHAIKSIDCCVLALNTFFDKKKVENHWNVLRKQIP